MRCKGVGDFAQELHVDGVAVEEDPLFVMLLTEVAFVGGAIQPGYHLGGFLGGHAATDFLGLLFEYLPVMGEFGLRPFLVIIYVSLLFPDLKGSDWIRR